jgi:signal peptide peptidase SppA
MFRLKSPEHFAQLSGETRLALDSEHFAARPQIGATREAAARIADAGRTARKGVAIIPVSGLLTPRGGSDWFGSWAGMDSLRAKIDNAADDPDVDAIVLAIDSPGGTVAGTPETAASVKRAAAAKKVVAIADTMACSAAYWIGAQASKFVATPSATLGSIGVMQAHVDYSAALAKDGVKVTLIRAGKYKNDANPYEPLGAEALAALQAETDDAYGDFVRAVAEGRRCSQQSVRDGMGEGRAVSAKQALAMNMIDAVETLDDLLTGLAGKKAAQAYRQRRAAIF